MGPAAEFVAPRGIDLDGADLVVIGIAEECKCALLDRFAIGCPVHGDRPVEPDFFVDPVLYRPDLLFCKGLHIGEIEP